MTNKTGRNLKQGVNFVCRLSKKHPVFPFAKMCAPRVCESVYVHKATTTPTTTSSTTTTTTTTTTTAATAMGLLT